MDLKTSIATPNTLTTIFQLIGTLKTLCVTNVYGLHRAEERIKMLNTLKRIHEALPSSHRIFKGDFNMILNLFEKKRGLRRLDKDTEAFRESIDQMEMVDVETHNDLFT